MTLEVELKAPCHGARKKVEALGAKFVNSQIQEDTYLTHPSRDFRKTDEALRIRRSDRLYITYKGPKKSSDVKAREELEFPVPQEAYVLLERLGFKKAFTIKKTRDVYGFEGLTICCDNVEGLGEYVEVESTKPEDRDRIFEVLGRLGIKDKATTKTYADLLGV